MNRYQFGFSSSSGFTDSSKIHTSISLTGSDCERLACKICTQIGDVIARKGGVVSAEELAPYLDVPAYSEDNKVILLLFYALWVPSVYFLLS